jgi:NAD(P)-dependent dehydrogenase (short-subunit alcohol dehydrogenase family)
MSYRSVFKPGLFEGQTVIVTGGGSGIGRCTAHEIAALGAHVVITGRKPDKLATVKDEIEASGGSCESHAFDIREEAQVKDAVARIVAGRGRIHGLFNNAGGQFPSPAAAMSAKGLRRRGAQQPDRRLHRQPRGLHTSRWQARRLDREHGGRHEERLSQHGAHRAAAPAW